jgi:hypothetical protein
VVKPSNADYLQAFQNPKTAFTEPSLQVARPANNRWGLPRLMSGNFAVVCHMQLGEQAWAVRAFSRDVPDLRQRYHLISTHLGAHNGLHASIVGFRYVPNGIRVNGTTHPIVVMDWVPGTQLDAAIAKALTSQHELRRMSEAWIQLVTDLECLQIAHGDLQHGNVLADGTSLRLVDYDGMYVPSMAGMAANEQGHRNYQHPQRDKQGFNESMDRFSALLIYTGLCALAHDPGLWQRHGMPDEAVLFRQADLQDPNRSKLFAELLACQNPTVRRLSMTLRDSLESGDLPPAISELAKTDAVVRSTTDAAGWWKQAEKPHQPTAQATASPEASQPLGTGWARILKDTGAAGLGGSATRPIWVKRQQSSAPPRGTAQVHFVASIWSDVFHLPDCNSAKKIEPHNLVGFASVSEAEAWGHTACKVCRPLQLRIAPDPQAISGAPASTSQSATFQAPTSTGQPRWDPGKVKAVIRSPAVAPPSAPRPVQLPVVRVDIGSTVKLRYENGKLDIVRLVGAGNAQWGNHQVADNTPLGTAIKGAHVGDTVRYRQFGAYREATIVEIM